MTDERKKRVEAACARFTLIEALVVLQGYRSFDVPRAKKREAEETQRLASIVVSEASLKELWSIITAPEAPAAARYQVVIQLIEEGNSHHDGEALNDLAHQLVELRRHVLGG